jgi:beta-glucosidase/6-phospho-beta-glucosidase/beta-galactosidase
MIRLYISKVAPQQHSLIRQCIRKPLFRTEGMNMEDFIFATGIENSYPTITAPDGKDMRVDEMETCGHYKRWKEDFNLTKELGINFLRYGPPYYKAHLGPGRYDWSFSDETLNVLRGMNITPIIDLCHFGVPDWIGNFQNPEFPELFAQYADAFAVRYPWVQYYTPINEIFITATFSAQNGWWNERLSSETAFVTALKHLCKANVMAMEAICRTQPDVWFIQSESSEYFHPEDPVADMFDIDHPTRGIRFLNQKRFLSLDLIYRYPVMGVMLEYLYDNGMTQDEYHWFARRKFSARQVMGNDYYVTNEHLVNADGRVEPSGEIFGYYVITHQYFDRYHLPIMHTETNLADSEKAPQWLYKEWMNMVRLQRDGVPIRGFTWYSLTDQIDWDSALRVPNGNVNPVGLYDLDRKIRPVGQAYRKLIHDWQSVLREEQRRGIVRQ